jgi:hypothetical protein
MLAPIGKVACARFVDSCLTSRISNGSALAAVLFAKVFGETELAAVTPRRMTTQHLPTGDDFRSII